MALKKRPDGRYTATASVNGKRKYFYGRTRAEAQGKCDAYLSQIKKASHFDDTLLFRDWVDIWASIKEKSVTANTMQSYMGTINRYILPRLGSMRLVDINYIMLRNLIDEMELSPRTIAYTHTLLKSILRQAVIDEILYRNPMDKVSSPKKRKTREMITLTKEQVKEYLSVITNKELYAIFKLAFTSGLRRSELLGLRWQDVNFKTGTLTVNQTAIKINGHSEISPTTKTKSSRRTITLDSETLSVLKGHRKVVDSRRFQTFDRINNDLVFPGRNGGPRNPDELTKVSREYAKKIGVKGFSMHGTRHTHATLLIEAGVNFKVIQMRLGHSSFKETMDTYSHVTPAMETDVIAKIQNIF